ncbi:uncharacterized protein LOC119431360 isoform X3 [Dermacentor silvarum]|uniref:uncharacterized protein LOC119431360 isoform X3 n=1 Tax=Dermacentor silvarum TaxID=543639 RepID=UPI0021016D8B|nr:uncharacterized protein LOC119431360 isoform X3 [Dermacentor silvarum]
MLAHKKRVELSKCFLRRACLFFCFRSLAATLSTPAAQKTVFPALPAIFDNILMLERYTGVAQAHTNRTDKAYPVDNQIIIKYVIDYNLHREIIRILFTDYYSCVVLNSTLLGTMLWVKLDHLLKEEQMPYLCTLTYQLAAEDIRHVVYDWKVCPEMRSYKENTKRPNVGQKREPQ